MPFELGEARARELVGAWLRSRGFFRDPRLRSASIDDMRGVYVPAYLYAAVARSDYAAEIGENYTETETYSTKNEKGETVLRTRQVTKTEWRSLTGRRAGYVMDVLVTASRGLHNDELEQVEPFDLARLRRYEPALIAGWIAEEPTLARDACWELARREAVGKIEQMLAAFLPGDSQRNLRHSTRLEHESLALLHVPVWILAARHDPERPPLRIVMNGQTGEIFGRAPLSIVRIVLVVLVVAATVALAIWLGGRR